MLPIFGNIANFSRQSEANPIPTPVPRMRRYRSEAAFPDVSDAPVPAFEGVWLHLSQHREI